MALGDVKKITVTVLVGISDLANFMLVCSLIDNGLDGITESGLKLIKEKAPVIKEAVNGGYSNLTTLNIPIGLYVSYRELEHKLNKTLFFK